MPATALTREHCGRAPCGLDHTGAWRRREEVRSRFVVPAMEWAAEHLERVALAAAGLGGRGHGANTPCVNVWMEPFATVF